MANYLENYKCRQIQDFIDGTIQNLLIFGKPGTGKTFALKYIQGKLDCRLFTISEYIEKMNDCLYARSKIDLSPETRYFWESVKHKTPKLMDDIGIEPKTENNQLLLYKFLNDREEGSRAVISTNLGQKELLERYDDRIISRMMQFTFLEFGGDDWRKRNFSIQKPIFTENYDEEN